MIRNIFRICCAGALVSAAASCTFDETADIKLVELGTPLEDNVCVIDAEGGEYELDIYSNGSYHVEVLAENDWLTLSALQGNGDGKIITGCHDGTFAESDGAGRQFRFQMLPDNGVHRRVLKNALRNHFIRAANRFFSRLENQLHTAAKLAFHILQLPGNS